MQLSISYSQLEPIVDLETVAAGVAGTISSCKPSGDGLFKVVVIALNKDLTFFTPTELIPGRTVALDVLADAVRLHWLPANIFY
jgi:hypothetical protein